MDASRRAEHAIRVCACSPSSGAAATDLKDHTRRPAHTTCAAVYATEYRGRRRVRLKLDTAEWQAAGHRQQRSMQRHVDAAVSVTGTLQDIGEDSPRLNFVAAVYIVQLAGVNQRRLARQAAGWRKGAKQLTLLPLTLTLTLAPAPTLLFTLTDTSWHDAAHRHRQGAPDASPRSAPRRHRAPPPRRPLRARRARQSPADPAILASTG